MRRTLFKREVPPTLAKWVAGVAIIGLLISLYITGFDIFASNSTSVGGGISNNSGQLRRQPASVATSNLVAHYPLDGNADDQVLTSGNTLTDTNTVTQAVAPPLAADFERDNSEYLEITDNATIDLGDIDFTITLWLKLESKPDGGGNMHIINKTSSDGTSNKEFTLAWLGGGTDRLHWWVADGSTTVIGSLNASTFGAPSLNTWYFVELWHSATDNQVGIRVNNGTADTAATSGAAGNSSGPWRIGTQALSPTTEPWAAYFDGAVDSMGFWKKLLTSDERTALYNSGKAVSYHQLSSSLYTNLSGYWDLDEASGTRYNSAGTTAADYTDNNTVTSTAGVSASLYTGPSAQFTSANSESLTVADSASISTGDIDFTLAGWVYFDSQSGEGVLVSKQTDTSTREFLLRYDNSTDKIVFDVYNGSGTSVGSVSTTSTISSKAWYFVLAWHDSTANTVNIAINNGTADSSATSGSPTDTSADLKLGARNSTPTAFLDGRLDEVAYWKRLLTTAEKTGLYNSGFGSTFTRLTQPLKHQLVSWWTLDESGGNRPDSVLRAVYSGTVSGASAAAGKFDQAYSFNGSSDYISTPSITPASSLSIAFWFKTSASTGTPIGWGTNRYCKVGIVTANKLSCPMDGSDAGSATSDDTIHDNIWYHAVIVSTGSAQTLYINGKAQSTSGAETLNTSAAALYIGSTPTPNTYFTGSIDDVRIFSTNLSAAQVLELYGGSNPITCDNNCRGWWKLNETSGTTATDSSNNAKNGTYTNSPTWRSAIFGNGMNMIRTDSQGSGVEHVVIADDSTLDFGTGSFAMEAWVMNRTDTNSITGTKHQAIISKMTGGSSPGYQLFLLDDGTIGGYVGHSDNSTTNAISAGATYKADNTWHHLVFIRDVDNGLLLYIDGALAASNTASSGKTANVSSDRDLMIGAQPGGASPSSPFNPSAYNGIIDDVRIYNRVLTSSEIISHYVAGR